MTLSEMTDTCTITIIISRDGSPHGLFLHSLMLKLLPFCLDVATAVNNSFPRFDCKHSSS